MLGPNWARVAQQPFRMFKGFTSEGGIRVPAFARFPPRFQGGRVTRACATDKDVMPTLLELAGVAPPVGKFDGREILPLQGSSMLGLLDGRNSSVHAENSVSGWEIFGKRAIRRGDWKILWETADATWWDAAAFNIRRNTWQLYNLADDPAELNDLSGAEPERLESMIQLWDQYARENGIIIPDKQRGY
jgi:arylsulfatase